MDIKRLILHPEYMDRETLYDLRSFIALHPYYQTARIVEKGVKVGKEMD